MATHSRLSASASSRWIACPGSLLLIEILRANKKIPERSTNAAAERGTAVHYVIEQVLLGNARLRHYLGKSVKADGMERALVMTQNDLEAAKRAIDSVEKTRQENPALELFVEEKFDLSGVYGAEMGGTSDIVILGRRVIDVRDYKNGRMPVEVKSNSQMRIYALGAYYSHRDRFNWTKRTKVRTTIIQPNAHHMDGPIRTEEFTIGDLVEWERGILVPAIDAAVKKNGKNLNLVPGEKQCEWCEAKPFCPAFKKAKPVVVKDPATNLGLIPLTDVGTLPEPEALSEEELAFVLENADRVVAFYTAAKKYAAQVLEKNPHAISGFITEPKFGNRTLTGDRKMLRMFRRNGLKLEDFELSESRMMRPTEIEAKLKEVFSWETARVKEFMDTITVREQNGVTIKRADSAESDFAGVAQGESAESTKTRKSRK